MRTNGDRPDTLRLGQLPLILMYHRLSEQSEGSLCVTPSRFADQMAWLKRHGLRGVGVGTLIDAMRSGRQRRLVGITFDDGFDGLVEAALPPLLRYGFTASMYIVSGRIGKTNDWDTDPVWPLMSAERIRELAAAGMEIGSHTVTHPRLADTDEDQVKTEVCDSKENLSDLIGAPIRGFAYPYGSMDGSAIRAIRDAGYEYACAVTTPIGELGIMTLPRMFMAECDGTLRMAAKRHLYKAYFASGRRA